LLVIEIIVVSDRQLGAEVGIVACH